MSALNTTRLDEIPGEVAVAASKTVESAWTVGTLLNEARELCGDDASFGAWRKTNITEPLGIAPRTQRTFQSIARAFKRESLPHFLGLTALADVASLPEQQQGIALEYLTDAASEGKRVPVSISTGVCQRVRKGAQLDELRHTYNLGTAINVQDVPADVERPEKAPVVIDNDTGEVDVTERINGAIRTRAANKGPEDFAKDVVRKLKNQNGHRAEWLGALKAELSAAGMLVVEKGSVGIEGGGKQAAIVVRD